MITMLMNPPLKLYFLKWLNDHDTYARFDGNAIDVGTKLLSLFPKMHSAPMYPKIPTDYLLAIDENLTIAIYLDYSMLENHVTLSTTVLTDTPDAPLSAHDRMTVQNALLPILENSILPVPEGKTGEP